MARAAGWPTQTVRILWFAHSRRGRGRAERGRCGRELVPSREELPPRALPLPRPMPVQLHARRPVRITARGSYMAAISFLMRVEKEHPLVALQSLAISSSGDPESQLISMVFEWPSKGRKSK